MASIEGIDSQKLKERRIIEKQESELRKNNNAKKGPGAHHPGVIGSLNSRRQSTVMSPRRSVTAARHSVIAAPNITSRPTSAYNQDILERNLLEELYDDRVFLLSLASDTSFMRSAGKVISQCVEEGLHYLDGRLEYWRMMNPVGRPASSKRTAAEKPKKTAKYMKRPASASLWVGNTGKPSETENVRKVVRPKSAVSQRVQ
ncbi:uncharacterized protein SPPG_07242 [Spizellomyces punctatus DAOM BR117]|uniref:Uncharacterized protein n=1 Tax=Spizellomyces punctatus (strain DAOM BR117) TaxID=645134 RepID=A0A0L0H9I4_SPIPD|nr:uncharacterized protein SPPG_07242 [Spizellomyces punctatus DAOM BR117]KNC97313.1 hypothetical protein SPPG_07242 [Spizellomyces punctatus DAOM BR117]|eukprot:XP_016605353.1 hypothetical protein SPPG_07242 [Spizellomyces punctatus DAOM BR117]